jgi:hypothetical protein
MDIVVFKRRFGFPFVFSAISSIILLLLSFSFAMHSLKHHMPYLILLIVFVTAVAIYCLYLKNPSGALHLNLSHSGNEVRVTVLNKYILSRSEFKALNNTGTTQMSSQQASSVYRVAKTSRSNLLGIWLHLVPALSDIDKKIVKNDVKMFIGRWQLEDRGFRSLCRHLIWYLEPMEGDNLC